MKHARRLDNAPPYLFVEIEDSIKKAQAQGVDVINLAIGDPDLPTPPFIINRMVEALKDQKYHCYPEYDGCIEFRTAAANYYKRRFGVELDPETEVLTLLGAKEGIAHIFFALVNEGDFTLVPDPQYPVYKNATGLTGGVPYPMPLLSENAFLPDFSRIPKELLKRTKILFLNYPNNPTGAVADLGFYQKAVEFALEYDIVVCNDNAYSEFTWDGFRAPSILEVKGAMRTSIEFHTLSKSYNMTGWRIGYAAGNAEIISKLKKMKHNIDSGVFTAIQAAGIEALDNGDEFISGMRAVYALRREIAAKMLHEAGFEFEMPRGTFYIWFKVPDGLTSKGFSDELLKKTGVVVAPGSGYGEYGEGFCRISLTVSDVRLREAFTRILSIR